MKVSFLSGAAVDQAIDRLISAHEEFHWAVAWGAHTQISKNLINSADKFRNVTFGISFCQTDPDLIDALIGVPNSYVATKFTGGTYHPKVYCFRSGDRVSAIVGSANFTRGGLGKNLEAAVELTGDIHDRALTDLLKFTQRSANLGECVTRELADRYRLNCKRVAQMPKAPRDPLAVATGLSSNAAASRLLAMSWDDYARSVRSAKHHDVDASLELLRIAQTWLASESSFRKLVPPQRKALAGVIGKRDKTDTELDRDWGWFGSMRGMGDFANRIKENDSYLARAIDSIPQKGEVTRDHYERFAVLFVKAFQNSHRTGKVPTASRLLAMKRPDVFLCISKPNVEQAASSMGFAKSTLDLENYWDRVVEVIRSADWYNIQKPDGPDGELWEGRAAMLDAILYRPQRR